MATKAEIIDDFFRGLDAYPWIPYKPVGEIMVREVERMGPDGLYLSTAAALVHKESGGKPVFGCDWGPKWTDVPPFCQVEVTGQRVKALIRNVNKGGRQNGVSYCQLTSIGLVKEAERLGGAHLASVNMRVGFRYLNDLIAQLGWPAGAAAYNAGPGNWRSVINTYGAEMAKKEREWAARLAKASAPPRPSPTEGGVLPQWVEKPLVRLERSTGGPYVRWVSGPFTKRAPAWVGPLPRPEEVAREGAFCAAAITFSLKENGIPLPEPADPEWEGGLLDYGRDFVEERGLAVPYKPGMEVRPMDLFIVKYTGPALDDQGHTWVMGRNGRAIQWDLPYGGNNRRTLAETVRLFSHGKTVHLIRREKWLRP